MNRRGLVLASAGALLPWRDTVAQTAAQPVPPFSTATPGEAPPPGWQHETLPNVERSNRFAVVLDENVPVLRVQSQASSSSLVATLPTMPTPAARLQWRWKVAGALPGSDITTKAGDDYAARLYVLFDFPLERLSFADSLRLRAARALSGRDIPAAALCYVWGQAQSAGASGWNAYTDRVRMIVVDSGNAQAGRWRSVTRDLAQDWQQSFGGPMPAVSAIAVGADTDNTASSATAWFGDVQLR